MEGGTAGAMDREEHYFYNSLLILYILSPVTVISLQFLQAPYGKHRRQGWGPCLPSTIAWIFMESPTIFFTFFLFPYGRYAFNLRSLALISVFLFHYLHRTCIYPLRLISLNNARSFPFSIAVLGFGFNLLNSYVQTRWISNYYDYRADSIFWWRFSAGFFVFVYGFWVNLSSDVILIRLKGEGGGYRIPEGGLFEMVSCPNYFGEIVEWFGWAIMTWAWAGFGFFVYTCSNLVPRAQANHKWYIDKFEGDYPKNRKVIIPFLF